MRNDWDIVLIRTAIVYELQAVLPLVSHIGDSTYTQLCMHCIPLHVQLMHVMHIRYKDTLEWSSCARVAHACRPGITCIRPLDLILQRKKH